jgi:Recombinase
LATRKQRRKREKGQRHAPEPVRLQRLDGRQLEEPADRLVYSREQAAQVLGISLATLDRRVMPAIATIKTEWGARLIPAAEFERYLAERTEEPRAPRRRPKRVGRKPVLPADVVSRILHESAHGVSLAEIARRLNWDGIPTAQGGRQWWPSTVRAVLSRLNEIAASR